jgi:hypothetical protein
MKMAVLAPSLFALVACATPTTHPIYPSSNVAHVYVVVSDGKLYAYPEVLVVRNKNTDIVWKLAAPPEYKFADEGIVIEDKRGEFDDCKGNARGKKAADGYSFTCRDNNKDQGKGPPRHYKYTIFVGEGPNRLSLDPWVVND